MQGNVACKPRKTLGLAMVFFKCPHMGAKMQDNVTFYPLMISSNQTMSFVS